MNLECGGEKKLTRYSNFVNEMFTTTISAFSFSAFHCVFEEVALFWSNLVKQEYALTFAFLCSGGPRYLTTFYLQIAYSHFKIGQKW